MTQDHGLFSTGMYADMMTQPDCWEAFLGKDLAAWRERVRSVPLGLIVGMGASYYAAQAAHLAMSGRGSVWQPVTADAVLHYLTDASPYGAAIAVSQSGESADTVAAAEKLQAAGASILSITNDPSSRLARLGSLSIDLGCGEEKGSATKTYTTSLLALFAAADGWPSAWQRVPEKGRAILEAVPVSGTADLLRTDHNHYLLGTGPNAATAQVAALLCKEKLFLHAEGSGAAEFAHGPLEVLDSRSTVWVLSTEARIDDVLLPLARRIARTGARLIVLGENTGRFSGDGISPLWTYEIPLEGPEELGTLLFLLPVQKLVLWEVARLGYPVDTFRRMDKVLRGYNYSAEQEGSGN